MERIMVYLEGLLKGNIYCGIYRAWGKMVNYLINLLMIMESTIRIDEGGRCPIYSFGRIFMDWMVSY